jgi:AcrR family transcriptional regulator
MVTTYRPDKGLGKNSAAEVDQMARPSSPILSAEKIARAALELVDATGEFTVGAVANRLGVRPSSLYNHVSGRDDIVEGMRALMMSDSTLKFDPDASWDEVFPLLLREYRDAFARHPRLIPMLTSYTVVSEPVMGMYGAMATILRRSGVPDDLLLDAITIMDSYVIGAALDVAAPDEVWDSGAATSDAMRAAIHAAPTGRARADRSFDIGLRVVLDGLRALAKD